MENNFWTFVSPDVFEKLMIDCSRQGIELRALNSASDEMRTYVGKSGAAYFKLQIEGDVIRHYRRADFYKVTNEVK